MYRFIQPIEQPTPWIGPTTIITLAESNWCQLRHRNFSTFWFFLMICNKRKVDDAQRVLFGIMYTRGCDKSRSIAEENPVGHSSSVLNEMLMSNLTIAVAFKWNSVQNNSSENRMNCFICIRSIRANKFLQRWMDVVLAHMTEPGNGYSLSHGTSLGTTNSERKAQSADRLL